jgi:hypothetical protein
VREYLERAAEIDSDYADAQAMLAFVTMVENT